MFIHFYNFINVGFILLYTVYIYSIILSLLDFIVIYPYQIVLLCIVIFIIYLYKRDRIINDRKSDSINIWHTCIIYKKNVTSVDIFVLFHIFILVNRSLPLSICAFILEKQETPTYTDLIYIYIL